MRNAIRPSTRLAILLVLPARTVLLRLIASLCLLAAVPAWVQNLPQSTSGIVAMVLSALVIRTATGGDIQASAIFFGPESDGGSAITGYTVTSSKNQGSSGEM